MPLDSANLSIAVNYTLTSPVTGFDAREQSGNIAFGGAIDPAEWDQAFAEQFTLSDTFNVVEIDLYEFVNQVCEQVQGARVLSWAVQVASAGDVVMIEAGDTDPALWFLQKYPGGVVIHGNGAESGQDELLAALGPTSRNLKFSLNPGSGGGGEATVTVIIFISTGVTG